MELWAPDCVEHVPANATGTDLPTLHRALSLFLRVWSVQDEAAQDKSCYWSVLGLSPEIWAPERGHSAAEAP